MDHSVCGLSLIKPLAPHPCRYIPPPQFQLHWSPQTPPPSKFVFNSLAPKCLHFTVALHSFPNGTVGL